jgi:hypothetical protein
LFILITNCIWFQVEAIQKCGGQTVADRSRFRTGGGILWNILKSREPKAYKEIMDKGKELEVLILYIHVTSLFQPLHSGHIIIIEIEMVK